VVVVVVAVVTVTVVVVVVIVIVVVVVVVVVVVSVSVVLVLVVVVVVVLVSVAVVLEVVVRDVVVLVVVVQPPSYEAWVPSPHDAHFWSDVAVAGTLTYVPGVHSVNGVHSRSSDPPDTGAEDSHSPWPHFVCAVHTTLLVAVACVEANSSPSAHVP